MKRSYYILGIIVTVLVVVGVFYFLRYRSEVATPETTNEAQNAGLPQTQTQSNPSGAQTPSPSGVGTNAGVGATGANVQRQKFGLVAQNQVLNYFIDNQNNAVIVQPDGQVVKVMNGSQSVLNSSAIANLISADFSYDGNKIITAFGNASTPQESIFDVAGKFWQPLSAGAKSVVWSPSSYQIAYIFNESGGVSAITTFDVSNPKAKANDLIKLHIEDVKLNWIAPGEIIISDKPSAYYAGSIWALDVKKKTMAAIVSDEPGLDSAWSGAANLGVIFTADISEHGGKLSFLDTSGKMLNDFTVLTLPSKCTFQVVGGQATTTKITSSTTNVAQTPFMYCALPRDADEFRASTLPDDYYKNKLFTVDDFYKINLNDGNITQVFADVSQNLDATDLKIFNGYLLFINRYDQKLYWISLK